MNSFLNIIVVPLGYARINKELFYESNDHILGAGTSIRSLQVFLFKDIGDQYKIQPFTLSRESLYLVAFLFTISSHGANLFKDINHFFCKSSVAFFIMVKGYRPGRHIYAGNNIPSLAIDQSKNSTSENFPTTFDNFIIVIGGN